MSLWQIAQAASRTRTSPRPGAASSNSSITSGSPNAWQTAALIAPKILSSRIVVDPGLPAAADQPAEGVVRPAAAARRRSGYCAHLPPAIASTRLRRLSGHRYGPTTITPSRRSARNDRHDHRKLPDAERGHPRCPGSRARRPPSRTSPRGWPPAALSSRTIVAAGSPAYGLTTGVAARKRHRLAPEDQSEHNRLMIDSLFMGQGPPAPEDVVRATILLLANGFASGTAGVRPLLVDRLVAALNDGEAVSVGIHGSLGMADLAPMAELARAVLGDLELAAKEAVSLVDNNAFSTAIASLAIHDLERLLDALDAAAALELEAFGANLSILHPAAAAVAPLSGRGARDRPPAHAPRRQLALARGQRSESAGSAELPLPPSGAWRSPRSARLRAPTARNRAERVAGESAHRPRGAAHHLGRKFRPDHPRHRARLPSPGSGTRRDLRVRTADQAHAGSCRPGSRRGCRTGPTSQRPSFRSSSTSPRRSPARPARSPPRSRTSFRRRALRRESKTG